MLQIIVFSKTVVRNNGRNFMRLTFIGALLASLPMLIFFQNCSNYSTPPLGDIAPEEIFSEAEDPSFSDDEPHKPEDPLPLPSEHGIKKLFVYQGRYEELATGKGKEEKLESVAQLMAKFEVITLTHGFTIGPKGTPGAEVEFTYSDFENQPERPRIYKPVRDQGTDFDGDGASDTADLIARIRQIRASQGLPPPQIFGYVALTADNINQWPMTQEELALHSNYVVSDHRGYVNFQKWVNKWISIAESHPDAFIDGFFLDMASEVYVHEVALVSMISWIKSLKRYWIMPNVVSLKEANLRYSGCSKFDGNKWRHLAAHDITQPKVGLNYPFVESGCDKLVNSIDTFSQLKDLEGNFLMTKGDRFLIEGFPLLQGSYLSPNELLEVPKKLKNLGRGLRWVTVAQELGYKPSCESEDAPKAGQTSQGLCQSSNPDVSCDSQNHQTSTEFARAQGAEAIFYTEANLGLYSNSKKSFCSDLPKKTVIN